MSSTRMDVNGVFDNENIDENLALEELSEGHDDE